MLHPHHLLVPRVLLQGVLATIAMVHGPMVCGQNQSGITYDIIAKGVVLDETTGDPIKGAMVIVRRDGLSQDLVVTNAQGAYSLQLERGSQYDISYSASGQVPKRVSISTKGAPAKLDVPTLTMTVDINLFPKVNDLSMALFEKPLGKAQYDSKSRNFVWDEAYGASMRASIRLAMARYDAQLEKQEAVAGR